MNVIFYYFITCNFIILLYVILLFYKRDIIARFLPNKSVVVGEKGSTAQRTHVRAKPALVLEKTNLELLWFFQAKIWYASWHWTGGSPDFGSIYKLLFFIFIIKREKYVSLKMFSFKKCLTNGCVFRDRAYWRMITGFAFAKLFRWKFWKELATLISLKFCLF